MPLTDQIQNAKPGQKPLKANRKDKKIKFLKDGNNRGKADGDRVGATKEAPKPRQLA